VVWSGLASDFKYRAVVQSSQLGFEDELAKLLVMCRITTRLSVVSLCTIVEFYTLDKLTFSHVRGDIPFLPVEEPRPAAQTSTPHIQHINALLYVTLRRGAGRGSNMTWSNRNGMAKILNVRSDLSRVHRGSRTERREFASLEPRKGSYCLETDLAATR
jgi:hypothetical protein